MNFKQAIERLEDSGLEAYLRQRNNTDYIFGCLNMVRSGYGWNCDERFFIEQHDIFWFAWLEYRQVEVVLNSSLNLDDGVRSIINYFQMRAAPTKEQAQIRGESIKELIYHIQENKFITDVAAEITIYPTNAKALDHRHLRMRKAPVYADKSQYWFSVYLESDERLRVTTIEPGIPQKTDHFATILDVITHLNLIRAKYNEQ